MAPGGGTLKKTQQGKLSNTQVVGGVHSSLISDPSTRPIYQRRFAKTSSRFNDSVTADVILTLHFEPCNVNDVKLYLHSDVLLGKSRYFSALFSDRWQTISVVDDDASSSDSSSRRNVVEKKAITFNVPSSMGSFVDTMTIMELFYSTDDDFPEAINTVSSALSIIDAALLLLFEDCVKACIRFLEAVSWNKEEEQRVLSLIPLLQSEETQKLLARFFPVTTNSCDEMLHAMVLEAVNPEHPDQLVNLGHPDQLASSMAFVAKFMRDFPSRDSLRYALTQTFEASLKVLKALLKNYARPYFLTDTEKVEKVMTQAKHIRWLIDMMIELRVGENVVKEWTDQHYLTYDVLRYFRKDYQWNGNAAALKIVAQVTECTCSLANAVASGLILADVQVRIKLVKVWLPVLNYGSEYLPGWLNKKDDESNYRDLEKAFLRIISTLPMTDSQELLTQCIRLFALNLKESPRRLLSAFTTWFRWAELNHQPSLLCLSEDSELSPASPEMVPGGGGTLKKTQSNTRVIGGVLISDTSTGQIYQRRFAKTSSRFNDSVTADVILTLHFEPSVNINGKDDVKLYLHEDVLLGKSRYFSALFSDRWQGRRSVVDDDDDYSSRRKKAITFNVPSSMGSFVDTMTIMELFYSTDDDFPEAINTVSSALSIIDAALHLLFEDCVKACIRFLEAVSWNKEEEQKVLSLIPLLQSDESQKLLARFFPVTTNSCDEMLHAMVLEAVNPEHPDHTDLASAKAFVAKFLRDFSSRDSLRCALTQTFEASLKVLNELFKRYSQYFNTEGERVQKVRSQSKHIRWLIEMMIELRVGENAVKEWTDQNYLTSYYLTDDVIKKFREDQRKNFCTAIIVAQVTECTCSLAAVASGLILADEQVRMKLVKGWLPVLIVSKGGVLLPKKSIGKVSSIFARDELVYCDLEKAFLRIISTLPMTDSQELLQQCIRLSALNLKERPHLLSAFTNWFRQAQLNHQPEKLD